MYKTYIKHIKHIKHKKHKKQQLFFIFQKRVFLKIEMNFYYV
jgi:hypothetical protein